MDVRATLRRVNRDSVRRKVSAARATARTAGAELRDRWHRLGPHAPVDYRDWVERQVGRRDASYPDVWRARCDLRPETTSRVGVVLHVHYPELLPGLLAAVEAIPVEFDLIVTHTGPAPVIGATSARHVRVLPVENHGRDIWPLVQVVNAGLLDPYEIVLKLHTKRSAWRADHAQLAGSGEQWRDELLTSLVGGTDTVRAILGAFAEDPDLGVVAGTGNLLGPEHWGANADLSRELLRRLAIPVEHADLSFAAGSFYWARGLVVQGLRSLAMDAEDFDPEDGQIDGTTAHAVERVLGLLTREAGLRLRAAGDLPAPAGGAWARYAAGAPRHPRVRAVPFYLPQFHPTAENSAWWGPGFTEWTNVAAARPVFEGHTQPNLPSELGFYDLRLDEVRAAQAALAREHGIGGFMYYYYWFAGRRMLSEPIERLLASDLDFPFCVMWANENWTRRWDGRTADILIGQDYDSVPAEEFIDDVLPLLADPRYLRVGGRAVLAVYRPGQLPDVAGTVEHWRARAREKGVGDLLILSVDVAREFDGLRGSAADHGLDGSLGFPPHNHRWEWVTTGGMGVDRRFAGNLLSYRAMVDDARLKLARLPAGDQPGVMVNFDNTARRQWAPDLWVGSNPYSFRRWLADACSAVADRPADERLVFVNAWNEWAESAVLEPSQRFGRTYLLAVRDVLHA